MVSSSHKSLSVHSSKDIELQLAGISRVGSGGMPHRYSDSSEKCLEGDIKSKSGHIRNQSQKMAPSQTSKQGTPNQNLTNYGKDVSPEEIDQLICQYSSKESYKSGPQSKDSILTERVKQDNLAQNFPFNPAPTMNMNNVIKVESYQSQTSSSPDRETSRVGFFTFGQNSIVDIKAANTDTIANLQEIYSAHKNLGV